MTRDEEIRTLFTLAHLETLLEPVLASDMTIADVRRLAVSLRAYCDADEIHAGVIPSMDDLADLPESVLAAAREVLVQAVAEAVGHRIPADGRPN